MVHRIEVKPGEPAAVLVKRAVGAGVAALRAEGERLRAAAHPGVVEVLASAGSDEAWELRLAHAGRPLSTAGSLTPTQAAGVAAAVAATLADLHEAGIVHGRVDAGHVLISGDGRPVLCGFGPATDGEPADDVAGVGALLADLLGPAADMEPIPDRRWRRRRWSGWDRRTLLLLADQACADPPSHRPTARRLAAAITAAVPDAQLGPPVLDEPARLPVDPIEALRPSADDEPEPGAGRLPLLAGAAVVVLVVAVGGVWALRPGGSPATPAGTSASAATTTRPGTDVTPAGRRPAALPPTTTRAEARPAPCVVLPGTAAGRCAPVQVAGTTVQVGAVRYEVGEAGDEIVLGDWDCDGSSTPALLRPATGDVFVFPSWAADAEVIVHRVTRVEGAIDLEVVPERGGCARLVARTPVGSVSVDLGTAT